MPTDLLTVTAAAERTGLPRTIISSWITTGQLPAVRVNGRRHIREEDLAETQARAHEGDVVPVWRKNRTRAGKRLRAIREAAGLNQIQLAAASGAQGRDGSGNARSRERPRTPRRCASWREPWA